jgi:hypothetical protein
MALSNFTELKASIADWMLRDDLTSVIPDFIALAEAHMNRQLESWKMEEMSALTVSSRYTALPSDFMSAKRVEVTTPYCIPLESMSRADMQQQRAELLDAGGRPQYYAITDSQLEVLPSPDASYTVNLYYKEKIPALSDSNTSNWVLADHPDLYLFGSLAAGFAYESDMEKALMYEQKFNALIAELNQQSRRDKHDGVGLRRKITAYT